MKKLFLICVAVIGISGISRAQGGGGGRQQRSPADQAAALKTSLSLTDDQVTKVTAIYTAQAASRDSVMKASNGDRAGMRTAMMPIQAATTAKIKAILTPDQATEFDKQQAAMRQRGGGGGGNGGGGGGGGK
jgi:protein CpxP